VWAFVPSAHLGIDDAHFDSIRIFLGVVVLYMVVRTRIALVDPPKLRWEYIFPPIDVGIVTVLLWLGHRDPLSTIALLYFFPLAQVASTLNWRWSAAVAVMVLIGAAIATRGMESVQPFNAWFRYFFVAVIASLTTMLARAAAYERMVLGIVKDRNQLALEMHDGIQAHLMTLSKRMELIEHVAATDPERAKGLALEGQDTARLAADELRYVVNRLRAPALHEGFVPAMRNFVHNVMSRRGAAYSFDVVGKEFEVSPEIEHAAFRIAQEAITNILRHANASSASVAINYSDRELSLRIEDDGVGFDSTMDSEGLEGIKRRAESTGGSLEIRSQIKKGSTLIATWPREVCNV
jgi:signal transduction histidine kinase